MQLLTLLLFSFISLIFSIETDEDYGDCRPLYTHNYGYKIYFHIPKASLLPDKSVNFNFSVKTSSDAHILFSPKPNPSDTDPVYEIVIGAGWNTFSDIRRLHGKGYRVTNMTKGIVSRDHMKKFWIKIKDGLISVGEVGSSSPILKHKDKDPLEVNYISFSSWHGSNAKWFFDCGDSSPLPAIVSNLTVSERLRNQLFSCYDPYVPPQSDDVFIVVNSSLTINYLFLDPARSSMDVRGMLRVSWFDFKLQWTPSDFDNIEIIRLMERKIWQPDLLLNNGATLHQKWFDEGIVIVNYLGEVTWNTPVHFVTRCNVKLDQWPSDEHSCQIQIGLPENQENVLLAGLADLTTMENGNDAGSWEVISVDEEETSNFQLNISSTITIGIKMKRYSSTHYYLFYVPLKVTMLMSVISFCLPYTCPQRVILQVMVLIHYVINILSIDSALPSVISVAPNIVSLSCGSMLVAVIGTILTMYLIRLSNSAKNSSIPLTLDKIVDAFTLRLNLFSSSNRGQKLMNLEDEDDEAESSIIKLKKGGKLSEKQRFQVFLLLLDYLLLIIVIVSYSVLIILF